MQKVTVKVYVLTIGKNLYYVTEDYEDAEYEKKTSENDTWQGRKQHIKLTEVDINTSEDGDKKFKLNNGIEYTGAEILNLL